MILDQLADRVSAAIWNLHPGRAVAVGKHEYDGQVPDLSAGAIAAGLERLGRLREQLAGLNGLTPEQELDRAVLLGVIDRERFDGETSQRWRRDPAWYLEPFDIAVYLERDYAPAGLRLERAAAVLGEAGGVLEAARQNLDAGLPRVWVEGAVARARSLAGRLGAQAEWAPAGRSAPAEAAWLREAAQFAAGELEAYAAWLEAERLPGAAEDFALGRGGLEEWLRDGEGLDWAGGDLAAAGAALLEEDRGGLASFAAPGLPAAGVGERVAGAAQPDPVAALPAAVAEARHFVSEKHLVGLPAARRLQVAAGLRPEPGEAGWLQAAGPYDDPATVPVLYVCPGEVGESAGALDDLAVAFAYPGGFLEALAAARAPGEARRRFPSRAFRQGWGLYAGDLMAEAGYRGARRDWRRVGLRRAVREDCRLICVAGLHGDEMTVGEAATLFSTEAGLDEVAARGEALRCAADPGCASGALGRVAFRRLRRRWEERPGEPSAGFLDWLLSAAALPVGLLDRLLP